MPCNTGNPPLTKPSVQEYHDALNGLWVAFSREFKDNADLFVVRRMVEVLRRGHEAGLPLSAAIPKDARDQ